MGKFAAAWPDSAASIGDTDARTDPTLAQGGFVPRQATAYTDPEEYTVDAA
jgi:hypothetical protein